MLARLNIPLSLLSALLLSSVSTCPQAASVGLKAGIPLTDVYNNNAVPDGAAHSSETRFTIGPTVELHLPLHFSVELDALWRQSSFSTNGGHFLGTGQQDSTVNDWQLPLLVKYQPWFGPVRPFLDAGPVYRHVSTTMSSAPAPSHGSSSGIAVGGGVSLKAWHLRLEPEIRYTRWLTSAFSCNLWRPGPKRK